MLQRAADHPRFGDEDRLEAAARVPFQGQGGESLLAAFADHGAHLDLPKISRRVELGVYTFAELTPEVEGGPVVSAERGCAT